MFDMTPQDNRPDRPDDPLYLALCALAGKWLDQHDLDEIAHRVERILNE
ncbi:hypothetical protein [Shimia sagamensis]|uniref:Uncharacterized protein n=1 Tax=Shimia sagamensis TaxID=1566352 RepID=A0ABY1PJ00_9RHOB|nr:hypothetical protein [Shimia sagamensis]SMP35341.1 hypothetical protein SAMN06265373_11174 [Shimia sagamensis]